MTELEMPTALRHYLDEAGRLRQYPTRRKLRQVALAWLAGQFLPGRDYTEKEVNAVIGAFYDDICLLRRELVDFRFLDRERDGSRYWLHDPQPEVPLP